MWRWRGGLAVILQTRRYRAHGRRKKGDNRVKAAAIILIIVGVGIVIWGGFGFKTREKVLDVGPIHATREEQHHVPYGTLAGAVLAIGGVVLLIKGRS